jgi:hypothetical protein
LLTQAGARAGASTVPKPHRTPFNFFSGALRDVIRAQHPQLSLSQALRKARLPPSHPPHPTHPHACMHACSAEYWVLTADICIAL